MTYNGNREFVRQTLKWAFQRTGVLRIAGTDHHRVNDTRSEFYRIKDDMVFTARIEQLKDDDWVPYLADDVQYARGGVRWADRASGPVADLCAGGTLPCCRAWP